MPQDEYLSTQQLVLLTMLVTIVISVFISASTVYMLENRKESQVSPIIKHTVNRIVERIIESPASQSSFDIELERKKWEELLKQATQTQSKSIETSLPDIARLIESLQLTIKQLASARGDALRGVVIDNTGRIVTVDLRSQATVFSQQSAEGIMPDVYKKDITQSPYSWLVLETPSIEHTHTPIATEVEVKLGTPVIAFEHSKTKEKMFKGYISSVTPSDTDEIVYIQSTFDTGYIPQPSTLLLTENGALVGIYAQQPTHIVIPLHSLQKKEKPNATQSEETNTP